MSIVKPAEYRAYPDAEPEQCCPKCLSTNIVQYKHVQDLDVGYNLPTIFVMDPHPRKPHMMIWVQITPSDDWVVIADGSIEGDCLETREYVEAIESDLRLQVVHRLIDPNMGASRSASSRDRDVTWQMEFDSAGLLMDLADDSSVGRERVNSMMKPDPHTHEPRLFIHPRCKDTIYQLKRYSWSDYKKGMDKDQKQVPSDKYSDYPTCLKYLANFDPCFNYLKEGGIIAGRGKRRGAY